jgi:hypothetical protein
VGFGELGSELYGIEKGLEPLPTELGIGADIPSAQLGVEGFGEVVGDPGRLGLEGAGAAQCGNGPIAPSGLQPSDPQIGMGFGRLGLEGDRPLVGANGGVEATACE